MTLRAAEIGWEHPDDPGEPSTCQPRRSITSKEAAFLSRLAADKHVVELGTGLGVSTRALTENALWVTTVDIDPWVHQTIVPDLIDQLLHVDFFIDRKFIRPQSADLVFIDADHHTKAVVADIAWARTICRPGGTIVCHDANYERVARALPDDCRLIDTEHGLALIAC